MKRACKKTRKKLLAFLNHQLEGETAKEIAQHLTTCVSCKKEAEEMGSAWELLDRMHLKESFPDLLSSILERIDKESDKASLFQQYLEKILQIPAPALCVLIFLLAIPSGTLLGKNLYCALSGQQEETVSTYSEEIPLDVFSDFPGQSLGNVYLEITTDSFEEDL